MGKRIVICCDGTGNSFDNISEDSNVVKLYTSLVNDAGQICYYHPGVGTMGAPHIRWRIIREWSRIKGLAVGAGLLDNIGDAYRYLMDTYVDGDEIFLFGFSRGAFTVRALASLLHMFGLLCAGNHGTVPYILEMYSKRSRAAHRARATPRPDYAFQWQFSHTNEVRIRFCGVWDTVSAYGWIYDPIELPFLGSNPIIDVGRHAVSIHERRYFYQDNLWSNPAPGQDIKQVWFVGVHSDIGGSYPETESGLSKIALEWMLVEAMKAGLAIESKKANVVLGKAEAPALVPRLPCYVPPNENAQLHNSLSGLWWGLEYLPHRYPHARGRRWSIPKGRNREIPEDAQIHESVLTSKWKPAGLYPHNVEPWVPF